jgi:hypothetical protein
MTTMRTITISLLALALAVTAFGVRTAQAVEGADGQVQIPLEIYQQLVEAGRQPAVAPAGYAIGQAQLNVRVVESDGKATAEVQVSLTIEVLEDRWVLVPILPAGTPVSSVAIGGNPIQLISTPGGLAWGVKEKGRYAMQLAYNVDATRSQAGFVLPLPTPEAAATQLSANLPGTGLDVAVIPASGVTTRVAGDQTNLSATIPATRGLQLSWRAPSLQSHTVSRALYSGELVGEAIRWTGDLSVELVGDETVTLELLPKTVTLSDIRVDGKTAAILVSGNHFATLVRGRGSHRLRIAFEVPVQRSDGPPSVSLMVPEIPVSHFKLTLPGRKEVTAAPATDVAHRVTEKTTVASFHVPMTRQLQLSWTEAIPEDLRTETRANASLFHAIHAEEGVLYVDALVAFEVSRGELSAIELELPSDVQVNRISSEAGGISDWRVTPGRAGEPQEVKVFLGHALSGEFRFRVHYDRSLPSRDAPIPIPLLRARAVHRQRGMVALLATNEVSLTPLEEANVTRVGENQLPPFFRRSIEKTIAHTFKYAEAAPTLVASATVPERVLAKFDAEVDTLISLTDVTMRGSATVNVNVKSGKLTGLELILPPDVNLLNLTAPSLRTHRVGGDDERRVTIEFTQDMEGQFRIEVLYERITADVESQVSVPTLRVVGAEVEQGRIAVEALAAVEVQVASAEQLSSLDPSELPRQLILKTTNPILLGYKYVHVDPPYQLVLKMTRHSEVDVQTAAIDSADYRTLFTADGLAVTTARFSVRNSRQQFLRVRLPEHAELWSATVDGKPEKPAAASNGNAESNGHAPQILIKVINSVQGFPVEIIYATPLSHMRPLGRVNAHLPLPDMVVTRSRWDLYLPDRFRYGTPTTNMDLVSNATSMSREQLAAEMAAVERSASTPQQLQPLQIQVPSAGVHFALEKLYANQAEEDASVSIPYTSDFGATLGQTIALLGTGLFWTGLWLAWRRPAQLPAQLGSRGALGLAGAGVILLLVPIGYLQTSAAPPLLLSLLALVAAAAYLGRDRLAAFRGRGTAVG